MLCFIGLGSNMGDRLSHLRGAVAQMAAYGLAPTMRSGIYETAPVGCPEPQSDYLNAVVGVETDMEPKALVAAILDIERELGRTRPAPNAPRTIDLDVLLMGGTVCTDAATTIPHPRMHERLFVLAPLRDIAPDVRHPVSGTTIEELYGARIKSGGERVSLFAPSVVSRKSLDL